MDRLELDEILGAIRDEIQAAIPAKMPPSCASCMFCTQPDGGDTHKKHHMILTRLTNWYVSIKTAIQSFLAIKLW